ncbi:MAG: DNA-processing protein DprA [Bdellovibrionota bacterium]
MNMTEPMTTYYAHAIALSLYPDLQYRDKKKLIEIYGGFSGFIQTLEHGNVLDPRHEPMFENLSRGLDLPRAHKELERLEKLGGWIMVYGTSEYPTHLGEIANPPLVLFGMGRTDFQEGKELGFVGPRKPSHYGHRVAQWLAKELVAHNMTLVSGLASGIDSVAHNIALESKGYTVAVVAHGLEHCYPSEHRRLLDWIIQDGTVISEYVPSTRTRREFFPARNRIISGLSRGVLIVEAGRKSGVRITANHAIEQYREVYAVPGPIDQELSMYPNMLIAEGAKMVRSPSDILEDFPMCLEEIDTTQTHSTGPAALTRVQRDVLAQFRGNQPRSIEELKQESRMTTQKLLQTLTELELEGWVSRQADARYTLLIK